MTAPEVVGGLVALGAFGLLGFSAGVLAEYRRARDLVALMDKRVADAVAERVRLAEEQNRQARERLDCGGVLLRAIVHALGVMSDDLHTDEQAEDALAALEVAYFNVPVELRHASARGERVPPPSPIPTEDPLDWSSAHAREALEAERAKRSSGESLL